MPRGPKGEKRPADVIGKVRLLGAKKALPGERQIAYNPSMVNAAQIPRMDSPQTMDSFRELVRGEFDPNSVRSQIAAIDSDADLKLRHMKGVVEEVIVGLTRRVRETGYWLPLASLRQGKITSTRLRKSRGFERV